jgi:hypothetical protein
VEARPPPRRPGPLTLLPPHIHGGRSTVRLRLGLEVEKEGGGGGDLGSGAGGHAGDTRQQISADDSGSAHYRG